MAPSIEYAILLDAPQTQTFRIRMRIRDVASATLEAALPVWRQGRYAVLNPAGTIRSVTAENGSGQTLSIAKRDKTTWRVETAGASEVVIDYTVYANSLNDRTRHVDDTHAFLSGSTVFMYVPDRRAEPVSVRIEAPASWKVASGLDHAPGNPRLLHAPDFDTLIDSPIEVGEHESFSFDVDGKRHDVVVWGDLAFDAARLERDFAKIVRTEAAIFGDLPYDRYVFIMHVAPGLRGGTEHLNSTIMQMPPRALEDDDQYKVLMSLAAHELFHVWNVKRLRPAALRHIDLAKENYTDLLWFCEGTTAYYDELIVVRAGLETPDAYLKKLAESVYQMRARPGSRVQSPAESSFDAWIKFNQPNSDDVNANVSFYEAGALVSLLLDLELRKRTGNRVSLDSLLREMYVAFPFTGSGFTTADLIATANRISASSFEDFFAKYVRGAERYPLEDAFTAVGIEMIPQDNTPRAYIGMQLQDDNGACMVRSVLSDGPAYLGGVNPGDQLVSLNGRSFNASGLLGHVEKLMKPGDAVWLQVLRRGRLRRLEFNLGTRPNPRWDLKKIASPTPQQAAGYASWLGVGI